MHDKNNINGTNYIDDIKPEEIFKYCEDIKIGDIVEGKIIDITNEGIFLDICSKTDALIPISEFKYQNIKNIFQTNQIIKVMILKLDYDNIHIVSYKKAKQLELKESLEYNFANKIPINAFIIQKLENSFLVDIGVDAILPFYEIKKDSREKINNFDSLVGKTLKVLIKELKYINNNLEIIVSHKLYEETIKQQLKEKLISNLNEDDEIIGEVKNLTSFGAFVEINGVETLLHIRDISWYKIKDPSEILNIGDKIKVKILNIDKETGRIQVGLKQLFPHPWDEVEKKYAVGNIISGKITNITKFGIFVELEPLVEGLVHISEISWEEKLPNLEKLYKKGQQIKVKILNIDKKNKKISLSIKKVTKNPWEDLKKEFNRGSKNRGKITKITSYGIFVTIKNNLEGLIHKSNISWTKKFIDLYKEYKVGQSIDYIILDILPEEEKAILSIKHLYPNPFEKYKIDNIVKIKIKKIFTNFLIVELEDKVEGIITKKEAIFDDKNISKDLKSIYKIGQELDAVIINCDENSKKIELSIRKLEKIIQKQLIKKFSQITQPTLGDILYEDKNK